MAKFVLDLAFDQDNTHRLKVQAAGQASIS